MDTYPHYITDGVVYVASHDGNPPYWLDDARPAHRLHVCTLLDAIAIRLSFVRRNRKLRTVKAGTGRDS